MILGLLQQQGGAGKTTLASTFILIPATPSPFDVWASHETTTLITKAQSIRPDINAAFAINRKVGKTAIGRAVAGAFADLPFPVLPAAVAQRIAFAETAEKGLTVFVVDSDYDARHDIENLAKSLPINLQQRTAA
jgi:chromosome partitioning protein